MGGPCGCAGCPDELGRDGPDVRSVPKSGAAGESGEAGDVETATRKFALALQYASLLRCTV